MNKLTKMATSAIAAAGIVAATITPASAADNGTGWAAVSYSKNGYCHLVVAPGSRAKAQLDKLNAIYTKHFTDANTEMRRRVAADLGLTSTQINLRQYSDADAAKIGMTKAQLQGLHDRLNRKGADEFLIPGGVSRFGIHDSQASTAKQVAFLKKDRVEKLGRGVYWVTNDAGVVNYVPPAPVKAYFAKRLTDVYAPVLADKQRGAELSNNAVSKCVESRHKGKLIGIPIGLADEIHRFDPNWKNPPTLQMIAAEKKKNDDSTPVPVPIPGPSINHPPLHTAPAPTPGKSAEERERERLRKVEASRWQAAAEAYYNQQEEKKNVRHGGGRGLLHGGAAYPVSLVGDDYVSDPNAKVAADGTVVYDSANGSDADNSGSSGLFGSS